MLLRRMVRMDMPRRLKAYRVLSLALCSLALVGWGAFADLRVELAQLKASQDQLLTERKQQQEAVGDLTQLEAKLVSTREELAALAHRREATAHVAPVQPDRTELTKWLVASGPKDLKRVPFRAAKPATNQGQGRSVPMVTSDQRLCAPQGSVTAWLIARPSPRARRRSRAHPDPRSRRRVRTLERCRRC